MCTWDSQCAHFYNILKDLSLDVSAEEITTNKVVNEKSIVYFNSKVTGIAKYVFTALPRCFAGFYFNSYSVREFHRILRGYYPRQRLWSRSLQFHGDIFRR